jgi:cobalt-zinc-cadmium efflux system protein
MSGHAHQRDHDAAHAHAGHAHGVTPDGDQRWLLVALLINLAFMAVEVAVGLIANSLALLSDAAHMLTDAFAIGLAIFALRLARRPAKGAFTFGFKRSEILSAQINGVLLVVLAGVIGIEAITRIADPPDVDGALVLWTGLLGTVVNGAAAWALAKATRESLNIKGAFLHNLFDMLSSIAAAAAGLVIVLSDWGQADGIAALAVSVLMLYGGWTLIRDSGRVLMEGAPKGLSPEEVGAAMAAWPGVIEVHDLHVWEVTSGFPALAAHVLVGEAEDCQQRRRDMAAMLRERFGIEHSTLQVEQWSGKSDLLRIEDNPRE